MKIHDLFSNKRLLFLSAVLFAFQLNARADDDTPALQIHGYGTAGYSSILEESGPSAGTYGVIDKSGTYLYNSLLGLNLSYTFNDKVTFYGQLTATGSYFASAQPTASYPVDVDMAMLSYHPFDWLDVRIGRQIAPLWMESEQIDVGVTYPWIRPPMDVYNLAPLKSMTGLGLDFQKSVGILDFKIGGRAGEGTYTDPTAYSAPVDLQRLYIGYGEFTFNNILKLRTSYGSAAVTASTVGANVISKSIAAADSGAYAGAYAAAYASCLLDGQSTTICTSVATTTAEGAAAAAPSASSQTTGSLTYQSEFTFYSFGAQLDWKNILLMGEYAATNQDITSITATDPNNIALAPDSGVYKYRAWYATAAYHAGDWTPHITYSSVDKNLYGATYNTLTSAMNALNSALTASTVAGVEALAGPSQQQNTLMLGLNYNFTPTIVGKAQFEQVRTNNAPNVSILNSPDIPGGDILNIGEAAISFVF